MAGKPKDKDRPKARLISVWDVFKADAPRAVTSDIGMFLLVGIVVLGFSTIGFALVVHIWPQLLGQFYVLFGSIDLYLLVAFIRLLTIVLQAYSLRRDDDSIALLPSIALFVLYVLVAGIVVVLWLHFLLGRLNAATGSGLAMDALTLWPITHLQHPLTQMPVATWLGYSYLSSMQRVILLLLSLSVELLRGRVSVLDQQTDEPTEPEVGLTALILALMGTNFRR